MQHLKVHYFQHIAGEGFGSCYAYLKSRGAQITATEFFALPTDHAIEIEALPNIQDVDLLIIMGGAMSVNDEANFPWLKTEKRWLRRYLASGKAAIGLCLGGQLIASSLGANVTRNLEQELGWHPIYKVERQQGDYFEMPSEIEVMHWHSETFDIPRGAVHLAETPVCRNQMYQIGKNVLGFQFHPEITAKVLEMFIEDEEHEHSFKGPYVQSFDTLKQSSVGRYQAGNLLLQSAIDYVLKQ